MILKMYSLLFKLIKKYFLTSFWQRILRGNVGLSESALTCKNNNPSKQDCKPPPTEATEGLEVNGDN